MEAYKILTYVFGSSTVVLFTLWIIEVIQEKKRIKRAQKLLSNLRNKSAKFRSKYLTKK